MKYLLLIVVASGVISGCLDGAVTGRTESISGPELVPAGTYIATKVLGSVVNNEELVLDITTIGDLKVKSCTLETRVIIKGSERAYIFGKKLTCVSDLVEYSQPLTSYAVGEDKKSPGIKVTCSKKGDICKTHAQEAIFSVAKDVNLSSIMIDVYKAGYKEIE
jgi:hypothetical protein